MASVMAGLKNGVAKAADIFIVQAETSRLDGETGLSRDARRLSLAEDAFMWIINDVNTKGLHGKAVINVSRCEPTFL